MAFYGYQGDAGESHWPPYSPYDHNDSCYSYDDYYCGNYYATHPQLNYSVYNSSDPRLIQYHETKLIVSYSTLAHDDTDFDEYDPDPYSGGYDIAQTYGKPLPPSHLICYPCSTPISNSPDLEHFSYASIPSPYGKDDDQPTKSEDVAKNREIVTIDVGKSEDLNEGDGKKETGRVEECDYGYDYDYQVGNIPYGSGLESVDICESLFGYWPCWDKYQKGNVSYQVSDQESYRDPWKSAADYLFGSPFGDGGDHPTDERFGYFSYGSYYQQEHQYLKDC